MQYPIPAGVYRHFKGKEYRVLHTAIHSETQEEYVVYQALYGDCGIWVRPASMWFEMVERDGNTHQRFTLLELCTNNDGPLGEALSQI